MTQPESPQQSPLQISPRGGPTGSEVTLTATSLPPLARISIGFGSFSQHEIIALLMTDGDGAFTQTAPVPPWAVRDQIHFFFASMGNQQPRDLSDGFHVTAADGTARVRGEISDEGNCRGLRGENDALYTLVGDTHEWPAGACVAVAGTIVDSARAGVRASRSR